jgi:RNA polymerase sigma-70 factor (ECF subfamily)
VETPVDEELLSRLRAGDPAAATRIVTQFHPRLLSIARSLLRNTADAEDACQDAWLSAFRSIASFDGRSSLFTWLARIAINAAKMRLRRQGRELSFEDVGDDAEPVDGRFEQDGHWRTPPMAWHYGSPEELLSEQDLRRCLDHTLEDLPDHQRAVLTMRDIQGLEIDEICNNLGIGASNFRVLLHRARTRVFRMIDHYSETGVC